MANLGVIGTSGLSTVQRLLVALQAGNVTPLQRIALGDLRVLSVDAKRDDVLGNPAAPSLQVRGCIDFGPLYWRVQAGSNTFNIDCRYGPDDGAATRPQVLVKANYAVGLHADQVVTIAAGADTWQTSPTLTVVAREVGVLKVFLRARNTRPDGANAIGAAGGSPAVYASWDNRVLG